MNANIIPHLCSTRKRSSSARAIFTPNQEKRDPFARAPAERSYPLPSALPREVPEDRTGRLKPEKRKCPEGTQSESNFAIPNNVWDTLHARAGSIDRAGGGGGGEGCCTCPECGAQPRVRVQLNINGNVFARPFDRRLWVCGLEVRARGREGVEGADG